MGGICSRQPDFEAVLLSTFFATLIIAGTSAVHILFLHQTGSRNPLGLNSNYDKLPFHQYYSVKDIIGFRGVFIIFTYICFFNP